MKKVTITFLSLAAASLLACFGAEFRIMDSASLPASRLVENYRELSGLNLVIASNVKKAEDTPIIVEPSHSKVVETAETIRLIERALLEQAGIIITRLDDKRASVTYNDALPVRPGERPLKGRFFRDKPEAAAKTRKEIAKSPNKIGRANRRPASRLNAGRQFGSASWSPRSLSAAVAHLWR